MPLNNHLAQGRLLYFTHGQDAISVYENKHFRWLSFGDVMQSIMKRRTPEKIVLPHQWALLSPLTQFTPSSITEFGLGGGSNLRFIKHLIGEIDYRVIESEQDVVDVSCRYFGINQYRENIVINDANDWIAHKPELTTDWLIYDIYQQPKFSSRQQNSALSTVIKKTSTQSYLSINLPIVTLPELHFWQDLISKALPTHTVSTYQVPHYNNKVLQVAPNLLKRHQRISVLSNKICAAWQKYHCHFLLK